MRTSTAAPGHCSTPSSPSSPSNDRKQQQPGPSRPKPVRRAYGNNFDSSGIRRFRDHAGMARRSAPTWDASAVFSSPPLDDGDGNEDVEGSLEAPQPVTRSLTQGSEAAPLSMAAILHDSSPDSVWPGDSPRGDVQTDVAASYAIFRSAKRKLNSSSVSPRDCSASSLFSRPPPVDSSPAASVKRKRGDKSSPYTSPPPSSFPRLADRAKPSGITHNHAGLLVFNDDADDEEDDDAEEVGQSSEGEDEAEVEQETTDRDTDGAESPLDSDRCRTPMLARLAAKLQAPTTAQTRILDWRSNTVAAVRRNQMPPPASPSIPVLRTPRKNKGKAKLEPPSPPRSAMKPDSDYKFSRGREPLIILSQNGTSYSSPIMPIAGPSSLLLRSAMEGGVSSGSRDGMSAAHASSSRLKDSGSPQQPSLHLPADYDAGGSEASSSISPHGYWASSIALDEDDYELAFSLIKTREEIRRVQGLPSRGRREVFNSPSLQRALMRGREIRNEEETREWIEFERQRREDMGEDEDDEVQSGESWDAGSDDEEDGDDEVEIPFTKEHHRLLSRARKPRGPPLTSEERSELLSLLQYLEDKLGKDATADEIEAALFGSFDGDDDRLTEPFDSDAEEGDKAYRFMEHLQRCYRLKAGERRLERALKDVEEAQKRVEEGEKELKEFLIKASGDMAQERKRIEEEGKVELQFCAREKGKGYVAASCLDTAEDKDDERSVHRPPAPTAAPAPSHPMSSRLSSPAKSWVRRLIDHSRSFLEPGSLYDIAKVEEGSPTDGVEKRREERRRRWAWAGGVKSKGAGKNSAHRFASAAESKARATVKGKKAFARNGPTTPARATKAAHKPKAKAKVAPAVEVAAQVKAPPPPRVRANAASAKSKAPSRGAKRQPANARRGAMKPKTTSTTTTAAKTKATTTRGAGAPGVEPVVRPSRKRGIAEVGEGDDDEADTKGEGLSIAGGTRSRRRVSRMPARYLD